MKCLLICLLLVVIGFTSHSSTEHVTMRIHEHSPAAGDTMHKFDTDVPSEKSVKQQERKQQADDSLTQTISAFYCKLLVVLGIAIPVTEVIAPQTSGHFAYHGFYLYLYMGSIAFLLYMYATLLNEKEEEDEDIQLHTPIRPRPRMKSSPCLDNLPINPQRTRRRSSVFGIDLVTWRQNLDKRPIGNEHVRYGSFYLRMGVAGFGVGSVIYSGIEFGRFFELRSDSGCGNLFMAVTPLCRIAFVLVQMLFIFTNNKLMEVYKYKVIAKFGLMHMIATNLCEWLYVLIEETKSDILYLPAVIPQHTADSSDEDDWDEIENLTSVVNSTPEINCYKTNIMGSLLKDASPYLFPCTVEYSLLCAVILAVMWKNVCRGASQPHGERKSGGSVIYSRSESYFSVDCASAYKGLFTSIFLMVITIISLIMFVELVHLPGYTEAAVTQVNVWECILFASATSAAVALMYRVRHISIQPGGRRLELEHILLIVTQSGVFLYGIFQVIGGIFTLDTDRSTRAITNVVVPIASLIQSALQTLVLLEASRRRCDTPTQLREKPGRQLVTFLLVANLAIWAINRLKNSRVEFKPGQTEFYGRFAWAVITHVCVPLVVCYRFQSTVCLYEIWKRVYKTKTSVV